MADLGLATGLHSLVLGDFVRAVPVGNECWDVYPAGAAEERQIGVAVKIAIYFAELIGGIA
ncbi:hypothetical protein D3C76_1783430 [compost metagenome]